MKQYMPQEIQVWYILPALRREFAKCFVEDFDLTQKKAAELLRVTEAAISQYFKSKRAKGVTFSEDVLDKVNEACRRVLEEESQVNEELYRLSVSRDVKKAMCKVHKEEDGNVEEGCNICFKHESQW